MILSKEREVNKMVAIYKYEMGLKFIGKIAESEEKAWEYLDKTYGRQFYGEWIGCNRDAFELKEVEVVE